MIKTLKKAACGALAALGVFASVCAMTACEKPQSDGPFTPTDPVAPDGLWLYYGNSRSRTDGSENADILTTVEINGSEFGADEYEIIEINYAVDTHEIFYSLRAADATYVYCYDYKEKTGEIKYSFPSDVKGVKTYFSDTYAYVRSENIGALFTLDGQFVTDDFYGTLLGDAVYRIDSDGFTWYRDGAVFCVAGGYNDQRMFRFDNGVYFLDEQRSYFIDLETGASSWLAPLDSDNYLYYGDMHYTDNTLYVVVHFQGKLDGKHGRWHYLYKLNGADAELVYEFGDAQFDQGVLIRFADAERLYFHVGNDGYDGQLLCYNIASGIMSEVSEVPSYPERDSKKRVGKYAFYVDGMKYAVEGGLLGIEYRTRYYLKRESGDHTEYLQYSDTDKKFFDDICEF